MTVICGADNRIPQLVLLCGLRGRDGAIAALYYVVTNGGQYQAGGHPDQQPDRQRECHRHQKLSLLACLKKDGQKPDEIGKKSQ